LFLAGPEGLGKKTSKLGLDVILWRTYRFMNIAYSTAIKN
jgi:hypothetical protein